MGKLFLAVVIFTTGVMALARPWIGINSYYLLAILGPQYVWWWNFQGLRVSLIIALTVMVGVSLNIIKKDYYDFNFLLNNRNYWLVLLWLSIVCSYFFGPYVDRYTSSSLNPSSLFSITNTIFVFYFISALELNETRKLRYLMIIFAFSTVYLIYWANIQYLSQSWWQFNNGRLMGPIAINGGSLYHDENAFAMLFVTGLPFIYYLGWEFKNNFFRYFLWLMIPLGWHAIFLTGSRGGLLGVAATLLFVLMLSNRKVLVVPLFVGFLLVFQWQAGGVMQQRSTQIANIEDEHSAGDRLTAWQGGLRMVIAHPITGIGLGSFVTALPDYIESRHMVAHNTFVQFAAESGVGAGLAYLVVVISFFIHSRKIHRWCHPAGDSDDELRLISLYNNASTASFSGLTVCALFLSLNIYEIFFVLLLFNNTLYQLCLKKFGVSVDVRVIPPKKRGVQK